jgi:hypothetical protein
LSLGAQVSQAGDSLTSTGLAALPALAFMLLIKLVFSGLPHSTPASQASADEDAADHQHQTSAGDHRGMPHALVADGPHNREEDTDPRDRQTELAQHIPAVGDGPQGVPARSAHDQTVAAPGPVTLGRMGHDSMNAALIYQHASTEADQAIASALDARLAQIQDGDDQAGDDPEDGPAGARVPVA